MANALQAALTTWFQLANVPAAVWSLDKVSSQLTLAASVACDEPTRSSMASQLALHAARSELTAQLELEIDGHVAIVQPIELELQPGCVLVLFGRKAELTRVAVAADALRAQVRQLAREEHEQKLKARFFRLAHEAVAIPDLMRAMQHIVESALGVANTDRATLCLLDKNQEFTHRACWPVDLDVPPPRMQGGVAEKLLERREPINVPDTTQYGLVRPKTSQQAISLLGVPILLGDEAVGVLFAYGSRRGQFSKRHENELRQLAEAASLALGPWRSLLNPFDEIEDATSKLMNFETIATTACQEIVDTFQFDYAALQLVHEGEKQLETVKVVGSVKSWEGLAKHSLDDPEDVRDIQVHIYKTKDSEVIHGDDRRFDRFIQETYQHHRFSRAFVPVILCRDEHGRLVEDWTEHALFEPPVRFGDGDKNYRIRLKLPTSLKEEVIGTLDTGYVEPRQIEADVLLALVKQVARQAPAISRTRLPYVLEGILERAMKVTRADSATLHFQYDEEEQRYVFDAAARNSLSQLMRERQPRPDGLGRSAVKAGAPRFVSDPDKLAKDNGSIFRMGVKAIGAFPIRAGEAEGVLYTHFREPHVFTENEKGWVTHLSRAAEAALRHAMAFGRLADQAFKLEQLARVVASLTEPDASDDPLQRLAWDTRNLLGADVVTLYEYVDRGASQFLTPPKLAGRLINESKMMAPIGGKDVPMLLIESGKNIYTTKPDKDEVLMGGDHQHKGWAPFVKREQIKATAALTLRTRDEILGVMFVNFRRRHLFPAWERKLLETLTATAAVAIRNYRLVANAEALADIGEIAGGIAHEVSSDVGLIRQLVSKVSVRVRARSTIQQRLNEISDSVDRILRARHERPEPLQLREIVDSALRKVGQPTHIGFENAVATGLPAVEAGRTQLVAIFVELFRNAMRAMAEGGELQIFAEKFHDRRRYLNVIVADSGPGIPASDRKRIFDRNYVNPRTSNRGGGFGLWWVKTCLSRFGGDVLAEENQPRGTRMVLRLPVHT